jgi:uncharacterized repeat protein (TIGR01451 family)
VSVIEVLDSRLVLVSSVASQGVYSSGLWTVGGVANGANVTLVIVVRVNGTGVIGNNVTVVTPDQNNTGKNNATSNNTTVDPAVNISVVKVVNSTTALNGDYLQYNITIINNGPDNATNIIISESLDSRLIFINATPSIGTYNNGSHTWTIPTLNIGANASLIIVVQINGTGNISNNIVINTTENNTGDNNSSSNNTTANKAVNITITKTANVTGNVLNGQTITYNITVKNNGPDNATDVVVIDTLDSRLIYINSIADTGFYNSSTGIWNIGNLNYGRSVTLLIIVRVNGTGNITNNANAISNETQTGNNKTNSTISSRNIISNSTIFVPDDLKVDHLVDITGVACDELGNPLANVILKVVVGGKTYSVTTKFDGSWILKISALSHGNYKFVVSWTGNTTHKGFANSTTALVDKYHTTVKVSTRTINEGKVAKISATLKDELGRNLANTKVTLTIKGKLYTGTTNSKGIATFLIKGLKGKVYNATARFTATNYYHGTSNSALQIVKPKVDLAIMKIKLLNASNKRTKSQVAYYKVTIKNKGSLKSKSTLFGIWHIRKGSKVETKYKKIKSLKGGEKITFIFKFYPDRDHHKYCMNHQYAVLNPKKYVKELSISKTNKLVKKYKTFTYKKHMTGEITYKNNMLRLKGTSKINWVNPIKVMKKMRIYNWS